ncbi:MAG: hypothetical protein JWP85_2448 [Rhodoglobus sp.]|nr:hypothetical protein [Rhodoglobus sp.]
MPYSIPFIKPVFPDPSVVAADFADIVASNWYTNFGPKERLFSAALGRYIGEGYHAVTFANATLALMALIQGTLGRGDGSRHVIVPSFTFAAGPASIEWAGYRPYFVDVDMDTLQPSLDDARRALENPQLDVAGVLVCNTFGIGNPAIAHWESLAAQHSVPLLVDSAAGFASRYANGAAVGTAGTAEVFSFHATKPFAVGEGGAVLTRDAALATRLSEFQNFGFSSGLGSVELGLNAKLQEVNAAIGLRQLELIDAAVADRQTVLATYREAFVEAPIRFPTNIESSSVCFASVLLPTHSARDAALAALLAAGVEARAYYSPAVHLQPHFASAPRSGDLPATGAVVDTVLSLPVHQGMPEESTSLIVRTLLESIDAA